MKNSKSVWNVKASQFPKNGGLVSKIKFLVRYGILAPSGHNSQPWIFEQDGKSLKIKPDYQRTRNVVDPDNRELFISLGAAAKKVEVAANYFGMIFEKVVDGETIVFSFREGLKVATNQEMFGAITKRWTDRGKFRERPVGKELMESWEKISCGEATVKCVDGKMRYEVGKLVYDSVLVWFKSKALMRELEGWLRDDVEGTKDGLPVGVLNLYKLAANVKLLMMRNEPEVKKKAQRDEELAVAAPMLAIVSSKYDNVNGWVEAGEAYQELALQLTHSGLQNGFFNTVLELGGQRNKLAKLLKLKSKPQLLLRVGYGIEPIKHTSRRPVDQVLRVVE